MARPDIIHYVITRLGIGIADEEWYRRRMPIFKAMAYSSLRAQTDRRFQWIVTCDIRAPAWLDVEFASLKADFPQLSLRRADPFKQFNLSPVSRSAIFSDAGDKLILTSRIDDDDCWSMDYVARVREVIDRQDPSLHRIALTLYDGYELVVNDRSLQHMTYPWHSMSVNLLTPPDNPITCYQYSHTKFAARAREQQYSVIEYGDGRRYWLYLRHAGADSGFKGRKARGKRMPFDQDVAKRLEGRFGVGVYERVESLFSLDAPSRPRPDAPLVHEILAADSRPRDLSRLELKVEILNRFRKLAAADAEKRTALQELFYQL